MLPKQPKHTGCPLQQRASPVCLSAASAVRRSADHSRRLCQTSDAAARRPAPLQPRPLRCPCLHGRRWRHGRSRFCWPVPPWRRCRRWRQRRHCCWRGRRCCRRPPQPRPLPPAAAPPRLLLLPPAAPRWGPSSESSERTAAAALRTPPCRCPAVRRSARPPSPRHPGCTPVIPHPRIQAALRSGIGLTRMMRGALPPGARRSCTKHSHVQLAGRSGGLPALHARRLAGAARAPRRQICYLPWPIRFITISCLVDRPTLVRSNTSNSL